MSKEKTRMILKSVSHKPRRSRSLPARAFVSVALACAALGIGAAPAAASVQWDVMPTWGPTTLQPGGSGEFVIRMRNVGSTDASGNVVFKDHLPPGVTATGAFEYGIYAIEGWTCFGTQTVTCVDSLEEFYGESGQRGKALTPTGMGADGLPRIYIPVTVSPTASGTYRNMATLSGGGGEPVTVANRVTIAPEPTEFGVLPESFETSGVFTSAFPGTELEHQAGTHPYELRFNFSMNLMHEEHTTASSGEGAPYTNPVGRVHTVEATLPRGFIGNPQTMPKCSTNDFLQGGSSQYNSTGCPANTQLGYMRLGLSFGTGGHGFGIFTGDNYFSRVALYNLVAPRGTPIDIGFRVGALVYGHIYASLDPSKDYRIVATSPDISDLAFVRQVQFTMWGVPADPSHDVFRAPTPLGFNNNGEGLFAPGTPAFGAPFENAPIKPFFTMPMDCGFENGALLMHADSWSEPGVFTPTLASPEPVNVSGCDDPRIRFEPTLAIQPTTRDASQPTGLDIHLNNPQRDNTVPSLEQIGDLYKGGNLHGIDTPPMKKVVVTMPPGMTISSTAAQGLGSCTATQIGIGNNDPVTCPDNSQYGTLTLHTPLLPTDEPMRGFIYIAKQNENPFNNFLSMYFVIEEPIRGLRVKIPGKIDLDPVTGQIKVTFDDLPQFPVSDMQLTFKSGVRAALVNPTTCGEKTISATFYSWSDPSTPHTVDSHYEVSHKADGSPCVKSLAERPFKAQMSAGTVNPNAESYSPFIFRMTRSDDDQELSQIGVNLPAGLTSKIAGLTFCSDEAIEAAANPARTGTEEKNNPSCPASSLIGQTDVGSGVGVPLTYFPGKVYLAGPYRGAPLSIAVISPVLAGPYDLGVIVVRSKVEVDPESTEIHVLSDPFPQIYQGIPVRIRDIRLKIDRPQTMLNPTNCNPKEISAHLTGAGGDVNSTADDTAADLSNRFQVANCSALGFAPKLSFKLKGGTSRGDHPALSTVLATNPGDANMSRVAVTLPHSEFLDQSHLQTVCTRVQFRAEECPAGSIIGWARAWTPLLDNPVEGPVLLRSSSHTLPDLVMALHGTINVYVVGRIDSVNGGLRTTFETIPDQPVSKFTLQLKGGGKGLLQNSTDLCKAQNKATVLIDGQNGKTADQSPVLANKCASASRKHHRAKRHRRHARHARKAG